MPLPYADPSRPKSAFARGVSKVFGDYKTKTAAVGRHIPMFRLVAR